MRRYLTAQGRMIADLCVYELGDVMLLMLRRRREGRRDGEARSVHLQRGRAAWRRHRDVRADRGGRTAGGARRSRRRSARSRADALAALPEHGNLRVDWRGGAAIVTRITDIGEPGFDVFVERAQARR